MKKFLLLFAICIPFLLSSCSSDDESTSQSVLVNVEYDGGLASPSLVQLYDYKDASKCKFDYEALCHYGDYRKLVDESGNEINPKYTSDQTNGVNILENVANGEYMITIMYKPSGYSFPNFYFYAYKKILVNADNNAKLYTVNFSNSDRGKFKQF